MEYRHLPHGKVNEKFSVLLNNVSRMVMVFLLVYFAYDSAKKQLAKTKL